MGKVETPSELEALTGMKVCRIATSLQTTLAICKHSTRHAITRDEGGSWDITELLDSKTTAEVKISKNLKYSIAQASDAKGETQLPLPNRNEAVQRRRQAQTSVQVPGSATQPQLTPSQSLAPDRGAVPNSSMEAIDLRHRFRRAETEISELQGALETATITIANKVRYPVLCYGLAFVLSADFGPYSGNSRRKYTT